MAQSTALEALTAELLGDVGLLHDEIKALRQNMPSVLDGYVKQAIAEIQQATREIELQTGANIAKVNEIESRIDAIRKDVGEYIREKTRLEVESAKLDLKKVAADAVTETATRAARELADYIGKTLDEQLSVKIAAINADGDALQAKINSSKSEYNVLIRSINDAKERADGITASSKWEVFTYGLIGSGVGGFLMVIAMLLRGP
ncbi:hypothetical protein ACWJKU_19820 (plasmid) [Methylocaldum sp. MU1018]|jgi:regulator of replication initiation timing